MFCGIWKSRCLSVLVSLAIPELLCESKQPVSIQEIADRTGCHTDEQIYKVTESDEDISSMGNWRGIKRRETL